LPAGLCSPGTRALHGVETYYLERAEITLPPYLADLERGQTQRVYATTEFPISIQPNTFVELVEQNATSMVSSFHAGVRSTAIFAISTSALGHIPRVRRPSIHRQLDASVNRGSAEYFFVDDNFISQQEDK